MGTDPIDGDHDRQELVRRLHEELAATAQRPVERTASRWLGEAQAVAADLVEVPDEPTLIRERAGHVASLLEHVDGTGDQKADEHVATAQALARRLTSG